MGKGIIKSGGDDGLYNVELALHRDRVDDTIKIIDAQIETLTTKINAMEEGDEKELEKLRRSSYQKRKDYLNDNMSEDPTVSAWCGDLTEDLGGNVGTIEIPGERGIVQIQPGYEGGAAYNITRDGQLQPAAASTPAGTFYNLAMLPGWQKWMPTYRHGVISNIDTDNDTCDVSLESAISSQQSLDVNQRGSLSGISIEYMSCNSTAFEDGDSVLVKFEGQKWSGAKVIGFKTNPKPCGFQIKLTRGDGTLITEIGGLLTYFDVWDKDWNWYENTTPVYTPKLDDFGEDVDGYWSFELVSPDPYNEDGYFVYYRCTDGVATQYPYRYKYVDKGKEEDLVILKGFHEDIIPYWVVTPKKIFLDGVEEPLGDIRLIFVDNKKESITVKSSVPYRVAFTATNFDNLSEQYESDAQPGCWCCPWEWRYAYGTHPVPWPWGNLPTDRKAVMVATNSEGDPEITDTDDTVIIVHEFPANWTVEEKTEKECWGLLDVSSLPFNLAFIMHQAYTDHCVPSSVGYSGTYEISAAGYNFYFNAKYDY